MLAARYLDGSIDALELLLSSKLCSKASSKPCSEPGSQSALVQHEQDAPQHQPQPFGPETHKAPGIGSADAGDGVQAASERRTRTPEELSSPQAEAEDPGLEASDTGTVSRPSDPDGRVSGGVPRRHASALSYDEFVLQYMAPNLPVMIQARSASAQWPQNGACLPTEHAYMLGQAGIIGRLCCLRGPPCICRV